MKTCNVFLKVIFLILLPLSQHTVNAQEDWELSLPLMHEHAQVLDLVETELGYLLLCSTLNVAAINRIRTWVYHLDHDAEITDIQGLNHPNKSIIAQEFIRDPSTNSFHIIAGAFDTLTNSGFGINHFRVQPDLFIESFDHIPMFNDSVSLSTASGFFDDDGSLVIPILGREPPTGSPNRVCLVRLSTNNELQASVKYGGGGFSIPKHAIPINADSLLVSVTRGASILPGSYSSFIYFDPDLDLAGGFPASNVMNNGPADPWNVLFNGMYMRQISNTSLVCSGQYNSGNSGFKAAAVRYNIDGTHEAQFLPSSEFFHDFSAIIQGHDSFHGGGLIHAYVENFYPDGSNQQLGNDPSRIRIHRLDHMLNPLCEFVIDGFVDNVYYYLNRIKATIDGGVVLMGSRRDLNSMGLPQAWVRKIAPNDCLTSLAEMHPGPQEASVFPNPGTAGFSLHVQGPVVLRGKVHLHDMHGREVLMEPINMSHAYIPAEELASGIYLYRVVDAQGRAVASGKWVKE